MTVYSFRMHGVLPSGEIWNTGLHGSSFLGIDDVASTWQAAVVNLWTGSQPNGIQQLFTTTVGVVGTITYQLDSTSGRAVDKVEQSLIHSGTATGNPLPQEVAVCVTLRTGHAGRRGRGRMFLPPPAASTLTANGRLSDVAALDLANGVYAMCGIMTAGGVATIIYSPGYPDRPLSQIEVGDVYDAQRRRRDSLVETRTIKGPILQPANLVRGPFGTSE